MFHCIATALSRVLQVPCTMLQIRRSFARSLSKNNIHKFLFKLVNDEEDNGAQQLLSGSYPLLNIFKNLTSGKITATEATHFVQKLISKSGTAFQGTDTLLRWITSNTSFFTKMGFGFLCFTDYGPDHVQPIPSSPPTSEKIQKDIPRIVLYNQGNSHWKLVNFYSPKDGKLFSTVGPQVLQHLYQCLSSSSSFSVSLPLPPSAPFLQQTSLSFSN